MKLGSQSHVTMILVLVSLCAFGASLTPVSVFASAPQPETTAPTVVTEITHGAHLRPVFIPGSGGSYYSYGHEIEAFDNLVGKDIGVVMYFAPWSEFDPFLVTMIRSYLPAARQPTIMITWEPTSNSTGCDLGYTNGLGPVRSIAQGRCDDYIRRYARAIQARPERYLLRMAHEMNITDSPWGAGNFGATPADYVAMWRRVHDIFTTVGVSNVEWLWSPNYASNPLESWNDLHAYYPGDNYVDWIGLSGYNWYSSRSRPWESFSTLYDAVLKDLTCRYRKPQILAEMASVDGGTAQASKAAWITDAYQKIPFYPFVRAVVWFNDYAYASRVGADFRVTTGAADCSLGGCSGVQSLPAITDAYKLAIADPTFTSVLPTLAAATPNAPLCGTTVAVSRQSGLILPGGNLDVLLSASFFDTPMPISVQAPSPLVATLSSASLLPPTDSAVLHLTVPAGTPLGIYTVIVQVGNERFELKINVVSVIHRTHLPLVRN